jgi:hypothetical protein
LSGADASAFELSTPTIASIVDGTDNFTVKPKMGLNVGTHTETVTVSGDNGISASFSVSFTVDKATLTAAHLDYALTGVDYNGSSQPVAVTLKTAYANMGAITVKYDGSTTAPVNAGVYAVTVDVDSTGENFNAIAELSLGNFTIGKATLTAAHLDYALTGVTYDGAAHGIATPTLKTAYANMGAITVKYDGSTTTPVNAGAYAVTVDVDGTGANFNATTGLSLGDFTIGKSPQAIIFEPAATLAVADGVHTLTATVETPAVGAPQLPVLFTVNDATLAEVSGNTLLPKQSGTVVVTAYVASDPNYEDAVEVARTIVLTGSYTLYFDAQGGEVDPADKAVVYDAAVGKIGRAHV